MGPRWTQLQVQLHRPRQALPSSGESSRLAFSGMRWNADSQFLVVAVHVMRRHLVHSCRQVMAEVRSVLLKAYSKLILVNIQ